MCLQQMSGRKQRASHREGAWAECAEPASQNHQKRSGSKMLRRRTLVHRDLPGTTEFKYAPPEDIVWLGGLSSEVVLTANHYRDTDKK